MITASRRYLWTVLALLVLCQTIAYIDRVNLSVAGPILIRRHGFTTASLGLLFSVFNWVFTLAILIAGPFVIGFAPARRTRSARACGRSAPCCAA